MTKGVLLSRSLAERTKMVVEAFGAGSVPNVDPRAIGQIAGLLHPVELTTDWEKDDDIPGWRARFRKLFFDPPTGEYHRSNHQEQEDFLYYPLDVGKRQRFSNHRRRNSDAVSEAIWGQCRHYRSAVFRHAVFRNKS